VNPKRALKNSAARAREMHRLYPFTRTVSSARAALIQSAASNPNAPETVVHACPPSDDGLTPCCGKTPFEFPATDRMTLDMALVTCQRRRNSAKTGA
jgi:hypothetical protein